MPKRLNKELFFEESLKLIHEKGFKATTLRDIAERLNFEVPNVYNYIDSKHALLAEHVADISKELHLSIDQVLDSSYTPEEKIRAIVSKHIQLAANRPYELALLTHEWRNLEGVDRKKYIKQRKAYSNKVKSIIEDGVEANQFRPLNIEMATFLILSSFRWIFDLYTGTAKVPNPIELEKQVVDFVFRGIGKNES